MGFLSRAAAGLYLSSKEGTAVTGTCSKVTHPTTPPCSHLGHGTGVHGEPGPWQVWLGLSGAAKVAGVWLTGTRAHWVAGVELWEREREERAGVVEHKRQREQELGCMYRHGAELSRPHFGGWAQGSSILSPFCSWLGSLELRTCDLFPSPKSALTHA